MKKYLIIIVLIFNASDMVFCQNLATIEKQYNRISDVWIKETFQLDSLKKILDQKINVIDSEKKRSNPDKNKIVEIMAGTSILSNKIENLQKNIDKIEKDLELLKNELNKQYTVKIDSLKKVLMTEGTNPGIEAEILSYTEKRFLVEPKITILSFDPKKVLEIDVDKFEDQKEKEAYKDFIRNALDEINLQLKEVNKSYKETSELLTIQEKTTKFLEEAEFETGLRPQRFSIEQDINSDINAGELLDNPPIRSDVLENANSYNIILGQLNFENFKISDKSTYNNSKTSFELKEYHRLLKEVREKLMDYKLLLSNKLKKI